MIMQNISDMMSFVDMCMKTFCCPGKNALLYGQNCCARYIDWSNMNFLFWEIPQKNIYKKLG